ncbi:two-component regulator propeller domain-containing protein [Spirosoma sp. 48-14]|uniref:ligand-binding sensor domain-containing protein n=1 Tax=Spirosoma sp. 48-14 TaxID=1895854 RepID=UPI00095E3090|nr:two-component regulator propeller domain-containing protein [Spirosoma sp. 48-14]OJW72665.1 MAG: hypothetical protein BGO59_16245 [Spirosoma sp. 48-14]
MREAKCTSFFWVFRMFKYLFLSLVLLPVICSNTFAQAASEKFIISRYTTENGLPQNSIKGLAIDHLGYCWIGTENGLVKYDGIHFHLYDAYDKPPVSSRVAYVKQNKRNEILIAFEGDQYYKIREFSGSGTRPVSVKGDYIVSDCPGFEALDTKSSRLFFQPLKKNQIEFSSDASFITGENCFFLVKPGSILIAKKNKPTRYIADKRIGKSPITIIGGQLVMISTNYKASIYKSDTGETEIVNTKGVFFDKISRSKAPYSLMCVASGTYAFCQGSLYKLTLDAHTINSELLVDGIQDFTPNDLYYEKESDTYYLQSAIDGLLSIRPNRFRNIRIPYGTWRQNSFYVQNLYKKDQIIANGTLFTFEKPTYQPAIKRLFLEPYSSFYSIVDHDNLYYEQNQWLHKFNLLTNTDSLIAFISDYIHCFRLSDYDSTLYFSTSKKIYSLKEDKPICRLVLPGTKSQYINGYLFLTKDSLLIGTSLGLISGNIRTGKARSIIPEINIRNIYLDKDGYTWLGTYTDGIYLLKSDTIKQLPIDANKRLSVINSIFEDKQGRIWFSTNNGLLSNKRSTIIQFFKGLGEIGPYSVYTKKDGLITNEFNGGAYPDKVYLSDGSVSLPSLKGLVVFNPDDFPVNYKSKHVFIENVNVNGRRADNLSQLTLPPDYNSLLITVSSPWINNPELLNFERMIEGYDREWIPFDNEEDISIRNLTYGAYRMRIRIKGYPSSLIFFNFKIEPYYYETIWFKLIISFIILAIIIVAFAYRVDYYQKMTISLDEKVKERSQELNESVNHLNHTVERLQFVESRLKASLVQKDRIINLLLHDMKSPLFALKSGIEELDYRLSIHEGLSEAVIRKIKLLKEGINDVYSFSVNFFEWLKYQQEGLSVNYQSTQLSEALHKIHDLYGGIAANKGILLEIPYTEAMLYTDENILVTILRNLVDNAIKNTLVGSVWLMAEVINNEYLILTIQDSGPGMNEQVLTEIQEAFAEDTISGDHFGYGYKLILHLLHLIHGDIELENNNGLQVRIILHIDPSNLS